MSDLTGAHHTRYSRHLRLPEIGASGQARLLDSAVLVVGAGGLGSANLAYLGAAGVGRIGIADDDDVDLSNLQRQVIHTSADIGRSKVASAAQRVTALNPDVEVITHQQRLTSENVWDIIDGYDVVVDATDNVASRYLLSDACALAGVADVWAGVHGFHGAVSVFHRGHGPCYRCLHPQPPGPGAPATGAGVGVLGALPGVIGAMQAVEAIKLLLGAGRPLIGRLACYDALHASWRTLAVAVSASCPICGPEASITTPADVAAAQAALAATSAAAARAVSSTDTTGSASRGTTTV